MTVWFTSDLHFKHKNIIRYCNRPFKDVDEMDEALIKNWNDRVHPDDTIYVLGDFGFAKAEVIGKIIDRLNGKIVMIYGNHDKVLKQNSKLREKFVKCCDYLEITVQGQPIILSHYAMLVWNRSHYGSWMLHGHSHGSLQYPFKAKIMDVGVDANGFKPISFEEVKLIMGKISTHQVDHHHINT